VTHNFHLVIGLVVKLEIILPFPVVLAEIKLEDVGEA
jgi:hypothetical protein